MGACRRKREADGMTDRVWCQEDGAPGQALRECIAAAVAAPSIHNTQPWLFRGCDGVLEVMVDTTRRLTAVDHDGREMLVSVGAALFNLRVAVRAHGRQPVVALMPDPARPELVARVQLGPDEAPTPSVAALAGAIPLRHTNRRPYQDQPVPPAVLTELGVAAEREGATLLVADGELRSAVLSLVRTADNAMREHPAYRAELAAWTTPGGVGRRDGVPRQAFGPRDARRAIPLRDFSLGNAAPTATARFEPDPTMILLFTGGDTRADWVRAGSALERLLLTATIRGLAATPLSQVVEVPRLRGLLADPAGGSFLQTVLRVGYPSMPVLATPRRSLDEVIVP
ncbi:Acg family FMN-binding oxidoreductase [Micromonospora sp. MS34]|uniref:Acg family FMN-binding oxidoreductase n=1 Tax=Micromonospora sp. MS34 TaxID=3385971 RepID=UPI0039A2AB10